MRRRQTALILLLTFALAGAATAQEPILTFSVSPERIAAPIGGRGEARVLVENASVREADDIAVASIGPELFSLASGPDSIKVLHPFETGSIPLLIAVSPEAPEGEHIATLDLFYTYCIGDLCFQIAESLAILVVVEPAPLSDNGEHAPITAIEPVKTVTPPPWPWIVFALAGLLVAGLLTLTRFAVGRRLALAGLILVVAGGLAYGVLTNQHEQAQGVGSVLCTSCVGIEEARPADVRLSLDAIAALQTLKADVELTVFYAEWCHACPFAEALVERMAEITERIDYRFVDVATAPDLAEALGVVRSGRTVVPAISREGSSEVLFGVEDLENRLLEFLGVGE